MVQVGSLYTSLTLESASFVSNMKKAVDTTLGGTRQMNRALADLKGALNPLEAEQQRFAQAVARTDVFLKQGKLSADEYGRAQQLLRQRLDDSVKSLNSHGHAVGANRAQQLELVHVVRSLGDSLASGQSPIRAFAVESGRLGQIAAGPGGLKAALGSLVTLIGGPYVIAAVAAIAATAGIAYAFYEASNKASLFEAKLKLTGNAAGLTRDRLREAGIQIATTGLASEHAGEKIAQSLAEAGVEGSANIGRLGNAFVRWAAVSGQSTDDIIKDFAKAAESPSKYADQVARALALKPEQIAHIRYLEDVGQKTRAFAELQDLLVAKLATAEPRLNAIGRAIRNIGINFTDAWTRITQAAEPATKGERLADASKQLLDAKARLAGPYGNRPDVKGEYTRALANYNAASATSSNEAQQADRDRAARERERKGIEADARLKGEFGSSGNPQIAYDRKFAAEKQAVADKLAALPNDPDALYRRAHEKQIGRGYHDEFFGKADKAKTARAANPLAAARADAGTDRDIDHARRALREAQVAASGSARDRYGLERSNVGSDLSDRVREVGDQGPGGTKRYNASQVQILDDLAKQAASQRQLALDKAEEDRVQREKLTITLADLSNAKDQQQALLSLADTAGERRKIELRLLALQIEEERARETAIVNSKLASDAEKQIAAARLQSIDATAGARREAVVNSTNSPGQEYASSLHRSTGQMQEDFQNLEVNGLKSLDSGLVGVIQRTKSLGSTFRELANQVIADLARMAVEKALIGPLAKQLGLDGGGTGGSSGGLAGWLTKLLGGQGGSSGSSGGFDFAAAVQHDFGGPRATGGAVSSSRFYMVGEKGPELFSPGTSGTIIPNSALGGGTSGGGGNTFNFYGPVTNPAEVRRSGAQAASQVGRMAIMGARRG